LESITILINEQYKGRTFTERLQEDMRNHVMEEKNKLFGYSPRFLESSIVSVMTTEKNPELKGVSTSPLLKDKNGKIIADLLNDNFGQWLSGIFTTAAVSGLREISVINTASQTKTLRVAGNASGALWNGIDDGSDGTVFQIGAGTTEVTRGDVNVESDFGVGDQANPFPPSGLGGFTKSTGIVQTSGSVVTSVLGGIIGECALLGNWKVIEDVGATLILLAHDNIEPNVTFLAGQTVNVEYSFQL
jgi:hypothetical protein